MKALVKTNLYVLVLFFSFSCLKGTDPQLDIREQDQIKMEVKKAAEPLMTGWAALDGSIAIKSFSRHMVSCYDTMLLAYEAYRQSWDFYTQARVSIKITPVREDFIILARDLVIDTWVGKVEEVMKTGERITYNPIRFTNLFKNEGGEWKIIFAQSSGIPVKDPVGGEP